MPERTLFSRHINKRKLNISDAFILESDIRRFNAMKRRAFRLDELPEETLKKSVHLMLKAEFRVNDYFANSAHNEAKAVRKTALEGMKRALETKRSRIKQMEKKVRDTKRRFTHLLKEKDSLRRRSLARGAGKKPPKFYTYRGSKDRLREDGTFAAGKAVYDNEYLFEVQYLDPEIRRLKHRVRVILRRIEHVRAEAARMEKRIKECDVSVCFGSKKLFHRQFAGDIPHDVWKRRFDRARNHRMTISGRKDAKGGNFVFRYDPLKKELRYKSMNGTTILLPCEFPWGQDLVEQAVLSSENAKSDPKTERRPVCWIIEDHGRSFLVKCVVKIDVPDMDHFFGNGCVGFDMNADNISFAETDSSGNLLHHKVIPFTLTGKTSEQTEHILSETLERVFRHAEKVRKPVCFEEIKDIKQKPMYRSRKLNRVLSMFAYAKISELTWSKSIKYRVAVKTVNPAFTSQIGKVKYQRKHGLSVHEAAAFVIARRGMYLKEKVPSHLRRLIPAEKNNRHHWSHWRTLHNRISKISWKEFYSIPAGIIS